MTAGSPPLRSDRLATPLAAPGDPPCGPAPALELPRRRFEFDRRFAVMGIVNRTPDSFYDRGASYGFAAALEQARGLVADGAEIVDIGGVKGGPGPEVSVEEEIGRVVDLVAALRSEEPDVLISVDTYRAPVADAALGAGADIVNDVTGLHDPEVLDVVVARQAGYIAMHHGGEPRTRPYRRTYLPDAVTEIVRHCRALTERAIEAGVPRERIVVDPGHDFQKTTAQSLEASRRLPELAALGFPVLVALSNKDFVGETLDAPLDRRVDGSLAAAVFSLLRGANIVRVHEVGRTVEAVRMTEALLGWRPPATSVRGLQ